VFANAAAPAQHAPVFFLAVNAHAAAPALHAPVFSLAVNAHAAAPALCAHVFLRAVFANAAAPALCAHVFLRAVNAHAAAPALHAPVFSLAVFANAAAPALHAPVFSLAVNAHAAAPALHARVFSLAVNADVSVFVPAAAPALHARVFSLAVFANAAAPALMTAACCNAVITFLQIRLGPQSINKRPFSNLGVAEPSNDVRPHTLQCGQRHMHEWRPPIFNFQPVQPFLHTKFVLSLLQFQVLHGFRNWFELQVFDKAVRIHQLNVSDVGVNLPGIPSRTAGVTR
jgi:hypothetical protein